MVSLEQQEKVVFLNSQYQDNSELIERLVEKLLNEAHSLELTPKQLADVQEYLQDKVTVFRFLRDAQFDLNKAHERLLETISWRIENGVADLTFESCIEFFEHPEGAFAYYHNTDKSNRPLIFVRLRYFPHEFRDPTKKLIHHIQNYACLMMEIGRKLTWDMTCDRQKKGEACVLVSQMTAIVNIQKAPMLPLDADIIKTMSMILDERFPGMVDTVNVLNFGWMYQGIWTVAKFLLSEQAKNSIRFTTAHELKPFISLDSMLQEMGGNDRFQWSFELDPVLQKYGTGHIKEQLPYTPPASEEHSRSNSISESESEEEMFYDATDSLSPPIPPSVVSLPPIPPDHLPIPMNTTSLTSRAGLRMGTDFLTSFIDHTPTPNEIIPTSSSNRKLSTSSIDHVYQPSSVIVVNAPRSTVVKEKTISNVNHLQMVSRRLTHRLLQFTLGQQRGAIYWVLLYFVLRGPVESFINKSIRRTSFIGPNYVSRTTIGITAVIATVFSTSLSDLVEKYRIDNDDK